MTGQNEEERKMEMRSEEEDRKDEMLIKRKGLKMRGTQRGH